MDAKLQSRIRARLRAGSWQAIQVFNGFFDETTLVICGDAIIDLRAALHKQAAKGRCAEVAALFRGDVPDQLTRHSGPRI